MDFKEAYGLGQERKQLEVTAKEYDAWPKGLVSTSPRIADDLANMTQEVRETARGEAEKILSPRNLLGRIGFNLGYLVGPHTIITSICTTDGPVNPLTGRVLYQR
ncbi:MAG: hypothetical protein WDZ69_00370 [Candidatus Pacearchaeota archaeon]